ncbi:TetR/AcrR family transcriptional regulator [Variovorax sp. J22G73]|uniref:TetR/AcrR family transcriptional regulator n=1 Tax=unclassified Variovorax TaxID=663243 RepID=UPI000D5DB69B|nr:MULTISPECIES: TetR/AcrR family transcriptional regulator [unclassified Variovorax]MDM0009162.1 TetR/AcrR family transcriptional regulator [Variovorax sp. J22R203]MDM0101669.1 TetR/AcrR family transcriptional regulator [Variovorax sp. J22G73]
MTSTRTPAAAPRRKPRQSRARHTSQALQEAFVRLWVEKGYAGVTIREIAAVAGTGLGSFYEYFENKDDLARVCLHLRSKALLMGMRAAVAAHAGRPLREIVDAVIDAQLDAHREQPLAWGAHYLLERHLSSPEAYRKMYDRFVAEWVGALDAAADLSPDCQKKEVARVCQTIIYGLVAHTHIGTGGRPDLQALSRQLRGALHGYLVGTAGMPGAAGAA